MPLLTPEEILAASLSDSALEQSLSDYEALPGKVKTEKVLAIVEGGGSAELSLLKAKLAKIHETSVEGSFHNRLSFAIDIKLMMCEFETGYFEKIEQFSRYDQDLLIQFAPLITAIDQATASTMASSLKENLPANQYALFVNKLRLSVGLVTPIEEFPLLQAVTQLNVPQAGHVFGFYTQPQPAAQLEEKEQAKDDEHSAQTAPSGLTF